MNYISEINHLIDTSSQYSNLSLAQKQALHQDVNAIYNTFWDLSQKYPKILNLIDWSKNIQNYLPNFTKQKVENIIETANNEADYIVHSDENVERKLIIANQNVIMIREENMGGDWQSAIDATIIITATTFEHIPDLKDQNHYLTHYVNTLGSISQDLYQKPLFKLSANQLKLIFEDLINTIYVFFVIDNQNITASILQKEVPDYFFDYKS